MRSFLSYIIVILLIAGFSDKLDAQCVLTPNFNVWEDEGDSSAQWSSINNGTQAFQNYNSWYPSFFVGPDTLINVHISGKFQVNTNGDDDFIGFVFGYQDPTNFGWIGNPPMPANLANTCDMDFYLFDWKKNQQTYSGYTALEGFTLNRVNGSFFGNIASVFPSFWAHTNSTAFQVLQTQYSTTNGWVAYTAYDFDLYYTPTRAVILVDSDTIFDQSGCFEPGRFGFYNMSQNNSLYWDFDYELYINFEIEDQSICLGDTAILTFIDTGTCYSANTFSNLDTFYWDLGDGTISNDTNPWHIYDSTGAYTVSLIATDINGCVDTASNLVYVHDDPIAQIEFDDVCLGDSMQLLDSTQLAYYGWISSWDWDFGDGSTDTNNQHPLHLYNQSGTYSVSLIVEDNAGCIDSTDTTVEVYPNPEPEFTWSDVCDGADMEFQQAATQGTCFDHRL